MCEVCKIEIRIGDIFWETAVGSCDAIRFPGGYSLPRGWALAVVIGIELLVSQVISWEVSVWVAMCGDGLLALGTLGLFLARIYRNREVDWLLLFVAVMMVLLAANHWEIAQSHPIAG